MSRATRQIVLVVDDDRIVLESLQALLEANGFEVAPASCADEAIALLEADLRPDAVLTDLSMPGRNGEELAAAIRTDPRCKDLPIVAMSACSRTLDHLQGKADSKLLKPFELPALLEALAHAREARSPR